MARLSHLITILQGIIASHGDMEEESGLCGWMILEESNRKFALPAFSQNLPDVAASIAEAAIRKARES